MALLKRISTDAVVVFALSGTAAAQGDCDGPWLLSEGVVTAAALVVPEVERTAEYQRVLPCAQRGIADAQAVLGRMYQNQYGVPRDNAEAIRWFRLAAEQEDAYGQVGLGWSYWSGRGKWPARCHLEPRQPPING